MIKELEFGTVPLDFSICKKFSLKGKYMIALYNNMTVRINIYTFSNRKIIFAVIRTR
jgi:hypothetical protein